MRSIRKLLAVGTGTVALCAVIAFALAPVTVLAEGTHQWGFWRGAALSVKSFKPTAAPTLSQACIDAIQAVKTAIAADRAEDKDERANAAGAAPVGDINEDATEKAAMKVLFTAARDACAPQLASPAAAAAAPSAACPAAEQAG